MKRTITIVLICCAVLAAIITPWVKLHQSSAEDRKRQLIGQISGSFLQTYGPAAKIDGIDEVTKVFVVLWSDAQYSHASMLIDGIWVEIAKVDKSSTSQQTQSPPGN